MCKSYSALGSWFEYLNDDCDYEKWSQYLIKRLKDAGVGQKGYDVGCGNGYFTRAFYKAGYDMTGVDVSPEMLDEATRRAKAEGVRAEFLLGDITKLNAHPKADFITAINDCLNYVPPEKLLPTFKRLYSCLNRGGALLFDISSEYKLTNVLGNNVFCEDRDELSYMWFNELDGNKLTMSLTFFFADKDGRYIRKDETHVQYAHGEEQVLSAMRAAGFSDVGSEGDLGGDKTYRINFFGRKL